VEHRSSQQGARDADDRGTFFFPSATTALESCPGAFVSPPVRFEAPSAMLGRLSGVFFVSNEADSPPPCRALHGGGSVPGAEVLDIESFQKRERDRKKRQKRLQKADRRKDRADAKRQGGDDGAPAGDSPNGEPAPAGTENTGEKRQVVLRSTTTPDPVPTRLPAPGTRLLVPRAKLLAPRAKLPAPKPDVPLQEPPR
jgi:hypothetical protein